MKSSKLFLISLFLSIESVAYGSPLIEFDTAPIEAIISESQRSISDNLKKQSILEDLGKNKKTPTIPSRIGEIKKNQDQFSKAQDTAQTKDIEFYEKTDSTGSIFEEVEPGLWIINENTQFEDYETYEEHKNSNMEEDLSLQNHLENDSGKVQSARQHNYFHYVPQKTKISSTTEDDDQQKSPIKAFATFIRTLIGGDARSQTNNKHLREELYPFSNLFNEINEEEPDAGHMHETEIEAEEEMISYYKPYPSPEVNATSLDLP